MRMLDLFCGAGGASVGYVLAGFEVEGVDIKHQRNYPYKFYQADALEFLEQHHLDYDCFHASPPCQLYSVTASLHDNEYPDMVGITRDALKKTGKPYIIENVIGAPLENPIILSGPMFDLKVIRRRAFEVWPWMLGPSLIKQNGGTNSHRGYSSFEKGADYITVAGNNYKKTDGEIAMGIDWMTKEELSEAIPPAYTEYLGKLFFEANQ